MLHGYEPTARFVLYVLNVIPGMISRFRDAYITLLDNEPIMVILSRTGSTSLTDERNNHLKDLEGFIDVNDDEFDTSFAIFRFRLPNKYHESAKEYFSKHGIPLTLREKTDKVVKALEEG
jgi:hypothetical protein